MLRTVQAIGCVIALAFASPAAAQAPGAPAPPGGAPSTAPVAMPPVQSLGPPTGQDPALAAGAEYVLGPEDVIEYDVVGTNDRTRARIYADGTFQTSFGTRLTAAGRTPRDLSAVISKALRDGGYYADPVVNVEVVGYASRYVTILGAVGAPGLVPINRRYRLSEILARVGGVRGDAADYVIVRSEAGPERRYVVDRIISGEAEQDPYVEAGDRIFAPPADLFYLSGQIRSPGSYPLKTGMTVAQAIAKGGGVTESGSDKKVKVRRGDKKITLRPDDKVEPGDVLTISERLF